MKDMNNGNESVNPETAAMEAGSSAGEAGYTARCREWILLEEGTVIEDGDLCLLRGGTSLRETRGTGEVYTSALFQPHFRLYEEA